MQAWVGSARVEFRRFTWQRGSRHPPRGLHGLDAVIAAAAARSLLNLAAHTTPCACGRLLLRRSSHRLNRRWRWSQAVCEPAHKSPGYRPKQPDLERFGSGSAVRTTPQKLPNIGRSSRILSASKPICDLVQTGH